MEQENLVLKNIEVYMLCASEYPSNKRSFDKILHNCMVVGQIQYWVWKANKQFSKIMEGIRQTRENLLTTYSDKEEDGTPKKIYEFTEENQKLYDAEVAEVGEDKEAIAKIAEKYCLKFPNGTPIIMLHFQDEQLKQLNNELEKLMNAENTFDFHKINISSKELEKMNIPKKIKNEAGQIEEVYDPILVQDMENLSCLIEFVA